MECAAQDREDRGFSPRRQVHAFPCTVADVAIHFWINRHAGAVLLRWRVGDETPSEASSTSPDQPTDLLALAVGVLAYARSHRRGSAGRVEVEADGVREVVDDHEQAEQLVRSRLGLPASGL